MNSLTYEKATNLLIYKEAIKAAVYAILFRNPNATHSCSDQLVNNIFLNVFHRNDH
jgi:hypothetical protein